jgi:hypothetical protein
MNMKYILTDDHQVEATDDFRRWSNWFETHRRHVAETTVGDLYVSTVFLGVDHSFSGDGPPVVFETMVFDRDQNGIDQRRYRTWDEACSGHADVVAGLGSGMTREELEAGAAVIALLIKYNAE